MYIDSLTLVAVVVFIVALAAFVRFCIIKVCGLSNSRNAGSDAGSMREKQA